MHQFTDERPFTPPGSSRSWSLLRPYNPLLTDWHGLRVWVVGASSGIGAATALALANEGAQVVVSARSAGALQRLVADGHGRIVSHPLDVTDAGAVQQVVQSVLAQGPVDLMVYCAGHYRAMRADHLDLPDMQRHLEINYTGALLVLDALLPSMLARGSGHISLVSSVAGYRGLPKSLAYGPTKAALTNLAENLYIDLQPRGLGVSVVHPGFVQTPLTAQNDFQMPALITPEQAAVAMIDGWTRGRFDIHYPKRFTRWMKLLRVLPYRLYFPVVRRFTGL